MEKFLSRAFATLLTVALAACGGNSGHSTTSGTASGNGQTGGGAGTIAYAAASYSVAQSAGSLTVSVSRTGGSAGAVSVAYETKDATAAAGTDYTAAAGSLDWATGDSTDKTFVVQVSDATLFVGAKTFTLQLSAASGGATLGSPATVTVTINGSAVAGAAGVIALAAPSFSGAQSGGGITISVTRTAGSSGAASVNYATANGTAVAGTDYTAVSGTLSWSDGDAVTKSFVIPVSSASLFTGSKTFAVALSAVMGAALGAPTSASVAITGSAKTTSAGVISLSASTYSIAQGAGALAVTVNRSQGTSGPVSISYATANGTAVAGTDYTATSGSLSWADGDASPKNISIPVSSAAGFSGTRNFQLALSAATGGATLGAPDQATVTINGSTQPGVFAFSSSNYNVAQSAGTLLLSVNRASGSTGAVSVNYATQDGTAAGGAQYTPSTGSLSWAAGDTAPKSIAVAISNATPFTGVKTFGVTLSTPSGGATLGSPSTTTVTINGSAGVVTSQAMGQLGAARLLGQATFGATVDTIAAAQTQSYDAWFANQLAVKPTNYLPSLSSTASDWTPLWWAGVLTAPDQLRQRVAFALSEIFVVSGSTQQLNGAPNSQAAYYDVLVNNSFSNFRTLLEQVTLSPNMGLYLNMFRNDKANPALGTHADENYAREIMQLFTIGLVMLNPDGTPQLDGSGNPIPTYSQAVVQDMARVFTGWASQPTNGTAYGEGSWGYSLDEVDPMIAYENHHDTGAKTIIAGTAVPAGGTCAADLKIALDALFNHPNVGPFIGKQLIQRLVTSNPSPAYVQRITAVFNNNGSGVRGDLGAVVKAILTDPEAVSPGGPTYGKLREPLLRVTNLWRGLNAADPALQYNEPNLTSNTMSYFGERPLYSPSVFNFFRPDFQRAGILTNANMVVPEFQITNESTMVLTENQLATLAYQYVDSTGTVHGGVDQDTSKFLNANNVLLHTAQFEAYASNPATLVDALNVVLMAGQMSSAMRTTLVNYATQIPANAPWSRVAETVSLIVSSPQYSVQR
jgi:uncharacterized protein (DUF1800 family)